MIIAESFADRRNIPRARLVDAVAPLLRLQSRLHARGVRKAPTDWRKLLILGEHHIGDVLYRTCGLEELAKGLPDCEIHYACTPVSAQVLEHNPFITQIWPDYTFEERSAIEPGRWDALKAAGFDAALVTSSIRYWTDLRLALRLGIPNRAGFTHKGFSGWVNHPVPIDWPQPYPHFMIQLVNHLVGRTDARQSLRPVMYPSAADRQEADVFLSQNQLGPETRWVAMFLTTRQPAARWEEDRFAALCDRLADSSVRCVFFGGGGDREYLETVARRVKIGPPLVCAGGLGLRALCAVLARCPAVFSTDSGPRHIANAAGAPVFFLRNVRSFQIETGPYCDTETDLVPDGELLDPHRQRRLLHSVSVEDVAGKLLAAQPL